MDKLSIFGLLVALSAIGLGYSLEGGVVSALFNGPALIIVLGGTLGAVMLQTSASTFKKMINMSSWVFVAPQYDIEDAIEQVKRWSHKARQEGYLALENEALAHPDAYAAKGLSLLVDGCSEQKLRDTLEIDLLLERDRLLEAARVYEAMGGLQPYHRYFRCGAWLNTGNVVYYRSTNAWRRRCNGIYCDHLWCWLS